MVLFFRLLGYIAQFFAGLYYVGIINTLGITPLIIKPKSTLFMNMHGYIGLIATLPIFIESTYKFTQTNQIGYIWLISFALFLAASFIIFRLPPKVRTDNYQLLYKNKFRIGAVLLLIANTSQYIAGITLGVSMFSIASICFVISMILLYFCKPYNSN